MTIDEAEEANYQFYKVLIRRNSDGVERFCEMPHPWYEFIWTEGNYSCDCNRGIFFAHADDDPTPDPQCGTGAYAVIKAVFSDGKEVLIDAEILIH